MLSYPGMLALSFNPMLQQQNSRFSRLRQTPSAMWLKSSTLATLTIGCEKQDGHLYLQVSMEVPLLQLLHTQA